MVMSDMAVGASGRRFNRGSWLALEAVALMGVASVALSVLRLVQVGDGCLIGPSNSLAAFGATLRDEVDQARLTDALLDVVEQTMRPASVSVWLRDVDSHVKAPPETGA